MDIGEFWTDVTLLCLLYGGKVISGPRSPVWNKSVKGKALSAHHVGFGADIEFKSNQVRDLATQQAKKFHLTVVPKHLTIHVEPENY